MTVYFILGIYCISYAYFLLIISVLTSAVFCVDFSRDIIGDAFWCSYWMSKNLHKFPEALLWERGNVTVDDIRLKIAVPSYL